MTRTAQLPLIREAQGEAKDVIAYVREHRDALRTALTTNGALLLRGFSVAGVEGFDGVVRELSGEPLAYAERSSPRSTIQGRVYTSTDYPQSEEIFLHNENSYQQSWPMTLYFYCVRPPTTLGATTIASTREVLARLDDSVREEFSRRGWQVVRNFHRGLGLPWQEVFNTDDRDQVLAYCHEHGIEARWLPGDSLRTVAVRDAFHRHPATGEEVWFNHAAFFHVSTLAAEIRDSLRRMFGEDGLPTNTYYGDGGAIPDDVMEHVRDCYRAATVRFDYREHDVLVIDNMITAHGREPFTGPRKIAVAMAEPHRALTEAELA
ncbi:TauD/TfdA family dioxygenase [Streptomyces sp. NPDC006602]|uniref:TauD/TfdA family dioxygenase n=1 Tax=Streptomyces sp. NPDC006602 TaxID=3364751 RepID=UPI00367D3985